MPSMIHFSLTRDNANALNFLLTGDNINISLVSCFLIENNLFVVVFNDVRNSD
jgi:hypothetical protein